MHSISLPSGRFCRVKLSIFTTLSMALIGLDEVTTKWRPVLACPGLSRLQFHLLYHVVYSVSLSVDLPWSLIDIVSNIHKNTLDVIIWMTLIFYLAISLKKCQNYEKNSDYISHVTHKELHTILLQISIVFFKNIWLDRNALET